MRLPLRMHFDSIVDADGAMVVDAHYSDFVPHVDAENLERIVAAVNATAGISIERLRTGIVKCEVPSE